MDDARDTKLARAKAERIALEKARADRLAELRDESLEDALQVVSSTMSFREVDPVSQDMPPGWVERYGLEEARRRLHVARAGWLPAKDAPSAVKLCFDLVRSAMGERGQSASPTLNVAIKVTETSSVKAEDLYEVIDMDGSEEDA